MNITAFPIVVIGFVGSAVADVHPITKGSLSIRIVNGVTRSGGRGDFQTSPPTDPFDASASITMRITDLAMTLSEHTWLPAECFKPRGSVPGLWRATLSVRGSETFACPNGPPSLRIIHNGGTERAGEMRTCTCNPTRRRLTCRQ